MEPNRISSRLFVALPLLIVVLTSCQTSPTPETKSERTAQTNAETAKQATPEKPSLHGRIENLSLYPVPNNGQDLAVSLVVSVRNAGAAGMAQDWTLAVNSPGRDDLKALTPVHVNGVVAMPGTAGTKVDLGKEDLALKSKDSPIAKGAELKGILTFVLPKTSAQELSNNNTSLTIHFKDSLGGAYQTPTTIIGAQR